MESKEIKIYRSLWTNAINILFGIVFTAIGCYMISRGDKLFLAWSTTLFFGCGGVIILYDLLKEQITHQPYMLITDKHVRVNTRKSFDIQFADVKSFYIINANVPTMGKGNLRFKKMPEFLIGIRYKNEVEQSKIENASTGGRIMRKFTSCWVGSQKSLFVGNLTLKPEEICKLLNERVPKSNTIEMRKTSDKNITTKKSVQIKS